MTMEDSDLKARLRLAQEKILRLEREIEDLNDLRETLRAILNSRPVQEDPTIQRWIDWSRNAVDLMRAKQRTQPKKSPAVRRAEMARLWAAKSEPGPS